LCEPEADAGDRGVDPDDPAGGVRERAAGVPRVQRGVGLDHVVDEPDQPAVTDRHRPAEGAHHADGHRPGESHRIADGDHQLSDAQRVRVAEGGRRPGVAAGGVRVGDAQHGEVREWVGADHLES
jgi:hypothetical protein